VSEEVLARMRRKFFPLYLIGLLASLIFLAHLVLNYIYTGKEQYLTLSMLTGLFSAYLAYSLAKLLRTKIPIYSYRKVVRCTQCGYEEEAEAKGGEILFGDAGSCPKCGGKMIVQKIYRKKQLKGILG